MPFCTNCGTPTGGEGKRFCTKCGAVLPEDPSADATQTAVTSTPPPILPDQPSIPPDQPATVTAEPFAVPPVPAAPEHPPTYDAPPGSWPPAQSAAPSYDAPPGSWPTAQAPTYGAPAGSWPPAQAPTYDAPPGSWPPAQAPGYDPTGPPRQPGPPDRPPRSNHTAAWIGFAVAAVLVLTGGGFAAWKFLGHHTNNNPSASSSTGAANQTGSGSSGSPAANSPSPLPTTPSAAPTSPGTSGGFPVAVSATAAQQPGEQQVLSFLQSYFTAINNHDYGQYAPLIVSSMRPTPAEFENGFGTTTDSNATLTGLVPYGTGVAAAVKFTSNQSPSASPDGASCDAWHIVLYLQPHGSSYRIGPAAPGYHARYRAC
jgi:hypothetical protein